MPFNIIRDDITRLDTDAIVNAANSRLLAGGGVCGAIFSAAGVDKLQKACDEIGHCKIGEAVITKGFDLKAKYIIHTVGPIYGQNPDCEEEQLYSCYKNSLELAKSNNLNSIAFPLISSGIYGYPKQEAIEIATRAIKDFLEENEMTVFLVVYDKNAFKISEKLFSVVKSYIDERMVKPDDRRRVPLIGNILAESAIGKATLAAKEPKSTNCADECITECRAFDATYEKKNKLKQKKSLEELLELETETFSEMLLRLIDEKGLTDVEVYKRANIDRKLFSKIRKKDYTPKKTTVVALAIALRLNMAEARLFLQRAGFALDNWSKFDVIIEYFIENQNYDIFEINETLFAFDEHLLGA